MLEYRVSARRIDSHGSEAVCKDAHITLDTDMAGQIDAFNPPVDLGPTFKWVVGLNTGYLLVEAAGEHISSDASPRGPF